MEFEWDPRKAAANERKHGVAFDFATLIFEDPLRIEELDDTDYEVEERWVAIGRVDEFVLTVVFTLRGENIRVISARRGTRGEFDRYWNGHISS